MPIGSFDLKAHTIGDKIYILCGYGKNGFMNSVLEFDPIKNSWSQKTCRPTYRYTFMSEVINRKIYVIGGDGTIDNGPWVSLKEWEYKKHVEIYDPQTDTWASGTSAPSNISSATSCSVNDNIYIFGGYVDGDYVNDSKSKITNVYNVTTNTWAIKSPASVARVSHASVSVGNTCFVMGGYTEYETSDVIELYSFENDTWKSFTFLPQARDCFLANPINNKIYIIGGLGGASSGWLRLKDVEILDTAMIGNE